MKRRVWWFWTGLALLALAPGCSGGVLDDLPELEEHTQEVIYGEDDRQDVYAHPDPALRDLTRSSIVALMQPGSIDDRDPNNVQILAGQTLGEARFLCPGQRFIDDPTASFCSATLIDDDLILTAGHCVETQAQCRGMRFVFNYHHEAEGELAPMTSDDVYSCNQLVVQRLDDSQDYAIIQLDRPVVGHEPAPVQREPEAVRPDGPVTCIGFPSGIPAKIDAGGTVTDPRADQLDFFRATTDTFGGNSGSGVFDEGGQVVGILVRGAQDYAFDGGCFVVNELPNEGGQPFGEEINYAFRAVQDLCESGFESERLCGDDPGGEGQWCDACAGDGDCLNGWACGSYDENPALTFCSAPCAGDGDCREDHACTPGGRCEPRTTRACVGGDVWTVSPCGQQVAIVQPCRVDQTCQAGSCVDIDPPDEGDLVITADAIVVSPANPIENEPAQITVTVRNQGLGQLVGPTLIEVFDERDGERVRLAEPIVIERTMEPGESQNLDFDVTFPVAGEYRVVVVGDPGEPDNAANNTAAITVTVGDDDNEGPVFVSITITEEGGNGNGIIEEGELIRATWVVQDPSGVAERLISVDGLPTIVTLEDTAVLGPLAAGEHILDFQARDADNSPELGPIETRTVVVVGNDSPSVVGVVPANGAADVALDATVLVSFDLPINPDTIDAGTFVLTPQGQAPVVINPQLVGDRQVSGTPAQPLLPNTRYTVRIFGVQDLQGDPMERPFEWSFTTEPLPTPAVSIITSPEDGALLDGQIPVFGTATDPNFLAYVLALAPEDDPNNAEPISDPVLTQVVNGQLGVFDTTGLEGRFFLILAVVDVDQNLNIDQHLVLIDRTAPQIVDIDTQPGELTEDTVGSYTITANIVDTGLGIGDGGVTIEVTVNGVTQPVEAMRAVGEDEYQFDVRRDWSTLGGATVSFQITAVDEGGRGVQSDVISTVVQRVNDPPVLLPLPVVQIDENDAAPRILDLSAFAQDEETPSELLTYTLRAVGNPNVEARLEAGRLVTLEANNNFTGITTVTVSVSDGQAVASGTFRVQVNPDSQAPEPNPPSFNLRPSVGPQPLTALMSAAAVSDRSGVEYFFEEVSGAQGGSDSGWQSGLTFTDADLIPGRTYTYRVKARDLSSQLNETAFSRSFSVTMPGQCEVCDAGARRCGGGGVQTCQADVNGCTDWSAAVFCRPDQVCEDGQCVSACTDECPGVGVEECRDDATRQTCGDFDADPCLEWGQFETCGDDEVCDDGGQCIVVCERDELEPNNEVELALWLQPDFYTDLQACGDDDWYAIDVRPGERLALDIFSEPGQGDLILELFDADAETLLEATEGREPEEQVFWVASESQTVYWRVRVEDGEAMPYDMRVRLGLPTAQVCVPEERQCVGRAAFQICTLDVEGLPTWGELERCGTGEVCGLDGLCREINLPEPPEEPTINDRFDGEENAGGRRYDACGCTTPARSPINPRLWPLLALAAGLIFARRRRR